MERRIVLLHDPRIQFGNMQQIDEELLKILQTSFKNHDFEEGLVQAIDHLKKRLLPHFGYKNDQKKGENSVPNKLIWLNE